MNKREVDEILYMLDGYAAMAVNEDRGMFFKAVALVETAVNELEDERYMHDRLQDYCVAQGEELSKLKAQQRWIPATERLPEDGFEVLVYTDRYGGRYEVAYYVPHLGAWYQNCALLIPNVTHWMPLPEAPKEDKK